MELTKWDEGTDEKARPAPAHLLWGLVEAAGTRCQSMVVAGRMTMPRDRRRTYRRRDCAIIAGGDVAAIAFALDSDRALRLPTRRERLQEGGLVAGGSRQASL